MAEGSAETYLVRDPEGNIYGPADPAMLREWAQQGRIVRGMSISPREMQNWIEVSAHPALADMFHAEKQGGGESPSQSPNQDQASSPPTDLRTVNPETAAPAQEAPVTRVERAGPTASTTQPMTIMVDYESAGNGERRQNIPGTIGLVAGIIGAAASLPACACICLWPFAGLLSLSAIVLSSIGLWQVRTYPERYATRSAPLTGLILGIVGLLLCASSIAMNIFFGAMSHR